MLNEQLACMTPFSHIDQPGLSWRTGGHGEGDSFLPFALRRRQTEEPLPPWAVQVFLPIVVSRWARKSKKPLCY
jgi:hypothetical protein